MYIYICSIFLSWWPYSVSDCASFFRTSANSYMLPHFARAQLIWCNLIILKLSRKFASKVPM